MVIIGASAGAFALGGLTGAIRWASGSSVDGERGLRSDVLPRSKSYERPPEAKSVGSYHFASKP